MEEDTVSEIAVKMAELMGGEAEDYTDVADQLLNFLVEKEYIELESDLPSK